MNYIQFWCMRLHTKYLGHRYHTTSCMHHISLHNMHHFIRYMIILRCLYNCMMTFLFELSSEKHREIQRNTEKYREIQRNTEKCDTELLQYRPSTMSRIRLYQMHYCVSKFVLLYVCIPIV